MLGLNGGLIGQVRAPSLGAASGVWTANEQNLYAKTVRWPGTNPIPSLNPLLWYDFADEAVQVYSGAQIASIASKGSSSRTLTGTSSGPGKGTWTNGITCCDFGIANHTFYLRDRNSALMALAEIYVVVDAEFGATMPNYNGLITGSEGGFYVNGIDNTFNLDGFNNWFVNNGSTVNPAPLPAINSPCLLRFKNDNNQVFNNFSGFQIGNDRTASSFGRGWSGLIGEVLVFSSVQTDQDRNTLQTFLASKWGLTLA